MNGYSGYGEVKLGDKTLPLKFGLNAYKLFCDYHSIDLDALESKMASPLSLVEVAYFAHVTAVRIKGGLTEVGMDEFIELVGDTKDVIEEIQKLVLSSRMWGQTMTELAEKAKKKNC